MPPSGSGQSNQPNAFKKVQDALAAITGKLTTSFTDLKKIMGQVVDDVKGDFVNAFQEAKELFTKMTPLVNAATTGLKLFGAGLGAVKTAVAGLVEGLRSGFDLARFTVGGIAGKIVEIGKDVFEVAHQAFDFTRFAITGIAGKFAEIVGDIGKAIANTRVGRAVKTIGGHIGRAVKSVGGRVGRAAKAIGGRFGRVGKAVAGAAGKGVKNVGGAALAGLGKVLGSIVPAIGIAASGVSKFISVVSETPEKIARFAAAIAAVSSKLVQMPLHLLEQSLGAIQSNIGRFVQLASPAVYTRFRMAVDDLNASLGRSLIPVLEKMTGIIRGVGGAFFGVSDVGKRLIQGIALGTVGLVTFGAAAGAIATVLSGGIVPVLVGITAVLIGMQVAGSNLKPVIEKFSSIFAGVMEHVAAAANRISPVVQPIIDLFSEVGEGVAGTISEIADTIRAIGPAFDDLKAVLVEFKTALAPLGKFIHELGVALLTETIKSLADTFQQAVPYVILFARAIGDLVNNVIRWVKELLGITVLPNVVPPRGAVENNTGAAARSVSTGSVDDALRRARESAFQLGSGAGEKPEVKVARNTDEINKRLEAATKELQVFFKTVEGIKTDIENIPVNIDKYITQFIDGVKSILPGGNDSKSGIAAGVTGGVIAGQSEQRSDFLGGLILGQLGRLNEGGKR